MILIVGDEKAESNAGPAEKEQIFAAYNKYTQDLKTAGVMLAGDALLPSAKGARVKVREGKRSVKDGPFAEAKEVVGGYYLIQVKSKEEAVEWASRCPGAQYGEIELREVMPM
ncbi:MAG: YciI family protein [Labilithrix sp.]|nr:YciI family protein [Labilithrix sp.]